MKDQISTMAKPGVNFSGMFVPHMALTVHLLCHRTHDPSLVSSMKHNVSSVSEASPAKSRRQTESCILSVVVEKHCNMIQEPGIAHGIYSPEQDF